MRSQVISKDSPVIELLDVTQHYGVRPVLRGISLRIERGEVVTILGPNGMGKIDVAGRDGRRALAPAWDGLDRRPEAPRVGGRRAGDPQDDGLSSRSALAAGQRRPAREFLLAVGQTLRGRGGSADAIMSISSSISSISRRRAIARSGTYSAGQKKKVALCSALVAEVPILLLDEPFSGGLDPGGPAHLEADHPAPRAAARMSTIVLTSPVPELVEEIATRIIVLQNGEILAFDTIDGLQRHDRPSRPAGRGARAADLPRDDPQARSLFSGLRVMARRTFSRFRQIAPASHGRSSSCGYFFVLEEAVRRYLESKNIPVAAPLGDSAAHVAGTCSWPRWRYGSRARDRRCIRSGTAVT